jgi:ankyrin repeat protein
MTDLVWSIKNGDRDEVKSKVESEKIDCKKEIVNGRSLLHYASDYGQNDVLEYLISMGCDVNALDKHGISCLLGKYPLFFLP